MSLLPSLLPSIRSDPLSQIRNEIRNSLRPSSTQSVEDLLGAQGEDPSLLKKIGRGALSGLGFVGGQLDKFTGSRAIRGMLGGKPRELASILPFSDYFGITDLGEMVTGEDLLGGELDPDAWDSRDVMGFGLEVLLDPTNALTFGAKNALTAAGRAVKKAGLLDESVQHMTRNLGKGGTREGLMSTSIDDLERSGFLTSGGAGDDLLERVMAAGDNIDTAEPLGGLLGMGTPFKQPSKILGVGSPGALKFAKRLDKYGGIIGRSPPARSMKALFGPLFRGAQSDVGQQISKENMLRLDREVGEGMKSITDAEIMLEKSGLLQGERGLRNSQRVSTFLEELGDDLDNLEGLSDLPAEFPGGLRDSLLQGRAAINSVFDEARNLGLDWQELRDVADTHYFPRLRQFVATDDINLSRVRRDARDAKVYSTFMPNALQREDFLKHIPGGTSALQKMSLDPEVSGAIARDGKSIAEIGEALRKHVQPEQLPKTSSFGKLARWLGELDPRHADNQIPIYNPDPAVAARRYIEHGKAATNSARTVHDLLAHQSKLADDATSGDITVRQALEGAGIKVADEQGHVHPGAVKFAETVTTSAEAKAKLGQVFEGVDESELAEVLENLYVPKEIAADAGRYMRAFVTPEEVGPLVRALDDITRWFKMGVTALFPAFHMRNFVSGQFNNYVSGAFDPRAGLIGPQKYIRPITDAFAMIRGNEVKDASKIAGMGGLDDMRATERLAGELVDHGVMHRGLGYADPSDIGPGVSGMWGNRIPGVDPISVDRLKSSIPSPRQVEPSWGKGTIQRGGQVLETGMRAGVTTGNFVEHLNRAAPYIAFRRQGYSAVEAARKVKMAQVDYRALTAFERKAMRRAIPFYSFTRRMLPFVFEDLIHRPAGRLGQAVRAQARAEREGPFLPDHLKGAIDVLPGGEEGTRKFLNRLGLAHEDVLELVQPGVTNFASVRNTLSNIGGRLNPAVKMPMELATGQSLFSSRDLRDMDGTIARLATTTTGQDHRFPLTDAIVANTPLARALSTARTLTDTRKEPWQKSLNLLTGARVSDHEIARTNELALRKLLEERLRSQGGIRRFESYYAPKDAVIDPQDRLLLDAYKTLSK